MPKRDNLCKIFFDESKQNYFAVSGFVLNSMIKKFVNGKYDLLEDLIISEYDNYNVYGTSFISYNIEEEVFHAYFIDKKN